MKFISSCVIAKSEATKQSFLKDCHALKAGLTIILLFLASFIFTGTAAAQSTNSLAGWWKLNDGAGTTATDSCSSGIPPCSAADATTEIGTLSGTTIPTWTSTSPVPIIGNTSALTFNGSSAYINVPNPTPNVSTWTSPNIRITGPISISLWFNTTASPGATGTILLDKPNSYFINFLGSGGSAVAFGIRGQGAVSGTSDSIQKYIPISSASNGQWHQVAGVYDGANLLIYFDGVLIGSKTTVVTTIDDTTYPLTIGSGGSTFFSGSIDDVRIYDRALSATEIGTLYTNGSGLAPGTSPGSTSYPSNPSPPSTPASITTPAPVINNGSPTIALPAGTTSTTLSVSTNVTATCKYDTANTTYANMANTFSTTNSTQHSTLLSNLTNNTSYLYFVSCMDTSTNVADTTNYVMAFSVQSATALPSTSSTEIIGHEALQSLPKEALWNLGGIGFRPGDGDTVTTNPPQFSWPYSPDPTVINTGINASNEDVEAKQFIFQASYSPYVTTPTAAGVASVTGFPVTTPLNIYNTIAPFTPGATVYWNVGYIHVGLNAFPSPGTPTGTPYYYSRVRSFTVTPTCTTGQISSTIKPCSTNWDRSILADGGSGPFSTYLAGKAAHPHLLFTAGTQAALASWLNGQSPSSDTGKSWVAIQTEANNAIRNTWWTNQQLPPIISSVSASNTSSTGTTISWTTDVPGTTQIQYGLTSSYGSSTTLVSSLTTSHSQTLTGLQPSSTYHYSVVSTDALGSIDGGDSTFKTTATGAATPPSVPGLGGATAPEAPATWANDIGAVALVYSMTQNSQYLNANATGSLVQQLVNLARFYVAQNGPSSDYITAGNYLANDITALSFGYDWLFNVMDGGASLAACQANWQQNCPQRYAILNALSLRAAWAVQGTLSIFYAPQNTTDGLVTYNSFFKLGSSHGIDNFNNAMLAALAAYGDDPVGSVCQNADGVGCLRDLFNLGINYMMGVTFPYGTDGSAGEGRGYSSGSLFNDRATLQTHVFAQIVFPQAQFYLNPYWSAATNWWDAMEPVDFIQGHEPWGDAGFGGEPLIWQYPSFGRDLGYFLNSSSVTRPEASIAYQHWSNEYQYSIVPGGYNGDAINYYELLVPFDFTQPSTSSSSSLNQFYPQSGWAVGSSLPQNAAPNSLNGNYYNNGVGYAFMARPGGGQGQHDHYNDLSYQLWAYGTAITDAGGQYAIQYAKTPMAAYSLLVNGIGTCEPYSTVLHPFYSRIYAYENGSNYTYMAADGTNAYPTQNFPCQFQDDGINPFAAAYSGGPLASVGLQKVRRHFIFVNHPSSILNHSNDSYFVIYDDFASQQPATFTALYHVLENTLNNTNWGNTGGFSYTSNIQDTLNIASSNFPPYTFSSTSTPYSTAIPSVPVYVQEIENPATITMTDQKGGQLASNPIPNPNPAALEVANGNDSPYEEYSPPNNCAASPSTCGEDLPRAHAIWISNAEQSTSFHFISVVYPENPADVASGKPAPTITPNTYTVNGVTTTDYNTAKVVNPDGTTDIISFDPSTSAANGATIVVNLLDINPIPVVDDTLANAEPVASTTTTTFGTLLYGDVLGSGRVTIYDAELTAQYAIGLPVPGFIRAQAQVDGNSTVDIYDAYLIAEYSIGLITKFPVQQ